VKGERAPILGKFAKGLFSGCKDSERNLGLLAVALIDLGIEFVFVGINARKKDTGYFAMDEI